jgi:hypothetical protein
LNIPAFLENPDILDTTVSKKNKKNKFKALALECQVSLNLFLSLLKTKKIIFSFYDGLFLVFFYACA